MKSDIIRDGLRFPGPVGWRIWGWFRNRCPWCKCLDMWNVGSEWTYLDNGKRVRLGAIECRACHKRWDWDDESR
jgi:hypothetical protein